jgi:hypothetical protein
VFVNAEEEEGITGAYPTKLLDIWFFFFFIIDFSFPLNNKYDCHAYTQLNEVTIKISLLIIIFLTSFD